MLRSMYEVWRRAGEAMEPGPRFFDLAEACRYVAEHEHAQECEIRKPDGVWYRPQPVKRAPMASRPHAAVAMATSGPLPSSHPSNGDARRPRSSSTPPGWVATILVVDDDRRTREGLAELLMDEGYRVAVASDGEQALARVEEVAPELVIADVRMPRMDGLDLVARLRERLGCWQLAIVLVSGNDDRDLVAGLELGADDFLQKPIDFPILLAKVRVHLRRLHSLA